MPANLQRKPTTNCSPVLINCQWSSRLLVIIIIIITADVLSHHCKLHQQSTSVGNIHVSVTLWLNLVHQHHYHYHHLLIYFRRHWHPLQFRLISAALSTITIIIIIIIDRSSVWWSQLIYWTVHLSYVVCRSECTIATQTSCPQHCHCEWPSAWPFPRGLHHLRLRPLATTTTTTIIISATSTGSCTLFVLITLICSPLSVSQSASQSDTHSVASCAVSLDPILTLSTSSPSSVALSLQPALSLSLSLFSSDSLARPGAHWWLTRHLAFAAADTRSRNVRLWSAVVVTWLVSPPPSPAPITLLFLSHHIQPIASAHSALGSVSVP